MQQPQRGVQTGSGIIIARARNSVGGITLRELQTHSKNKTSPLRVQAWAQLHLRINTPFGTRPNIQCLPSDTEHLMSNRSALRWGRSILTGVHFYSRGPVAFLKQMGPPDWMTPAVMDWHTCSPEIPSRLCWVQIAAGFILTWHGMSQHMCRDLNPNTKHI